MKQITHYGFTFYFDPSLKFCMVAFYSEFISLAVNKSNSKGIFCNPNQKQSETSKILIITLKVVYIRKLSLGVKKPSPSFICFCLSGFYVSYLFFTIPEIQGSRTQFQLTESELLVKKVNSLFLKQSLFSALMA